MAVTVTGPLDTPINITTTLQDGGSLDADTTYYFRVVAQTNSTTRNNINSRWSVPSVEGTFTTDSTKKQCLIGWDAVTGAYGYVVYLTKTSGDYRPAVTPKCGTDNTVSTTTNSYTVSANPTMNPNHIFASTQTIPCGLSKDVGRIIVSFTGTTTFQDIYDQVVADGYSDYIYYDGGVFALTGSIVLSGTTTASLTERDKVIIFTVGSIVNTNPNATLTFGSYYSAAQAGYRGCVFYHLSYGLRAFAASTGKINLLGCTLKGEGVGIIQEYFLFGGDYYALANTSAVDFSGARIETTFTDAYGSTDILVSSPARSFSLSGANVQTVTRPDLRYTYFFDYVGNNTQAINVIDGKFLGPNYDLRAGRASDDLTKFTNCVFPLRTGGIPIISWDQTSYRGAKQFWFGLDVLIRDASGVLSGATVTITDINGNAVTGSPFTTDVNGAISTELYSYRMTYAGPTNLDSTKTDQTPHTLTLSKPGYITQTHKITMDSKKDLVFTMEQTKDFNFSRQGRSLTQ